MEKSPFGGNMNRITPSLQNKATAKRGNGSGNRGGTGTTSTSGRCTLPCNDSSTNQTCVDSANKHESKRQKMDWDLEPFDKLNPTDNGQRILSRYKMIHKGKNTAGYTQYVQQIPKHERRIRSMDTPNTPDHTLDIPAKRWQGLVKAWRVALHQYDPPDLVSTRLDDTVVTKTPIRCVSIGKQSHHLSETSSSSPNMDDTTPISMKSGCESPSFFDHHHNNNNDDDDIAARNLDFDDVGGNNDDDDDDDDLI